MNLGISARLGALLDAMPRVSSGGGCGARGARAAATLRCVVLLTLGVVACEPSVEPSTPAVDGAPSTLDGDASTCPTDSIPSSQAPGTTSQHQDVNTWIAAEGADAVLLPREDLGALNKRFSDVVGGWRDIDGRGVGDPEQVQAAIDERIRVFGTELEAGRLQEGTAGAFAQARVVAKNSTRVDHFRVLVEEAPLRCSPIAGGLFRKPADPDFDRNACASLHPGERVRVLRRGPKGRWLYVHAGHTVGWLDAPTLTPRLNRDQLDAWTAPQRLVPLRDDVVTEDGWRLRLGVSLPVQTPEPGEASGPEAGWTVLVPDETGLRRAHISASQNVSAGYPALTRQAALDVVFSEQGDPYGWGGRAGERDCSRLLRDLFATFGVQLGRHSGVQAEQGMHNIDVSALQPEAKRRAIREAGKGGALVLLYMRGHIMLYLGPDDADGQLRDYAISAISEYLVPCEGGEPTVHRIDRVAVTTLALGADTSRTSYLERISRLVVFGPAGPGQRAEPQAAESPAAPPS